MGCPVSKRVQTSSDLTSPSNSQNGSSLQDENSNGYLWQAPRILPTHSDNNAIQSLHIPGQINNDVNSVLLKNRPSTRTRSQVEFFAMLDSKIEAGEDLKEEES